MEQQIHITLQFHLATGKVNLNEIVYRLQQLKNPLMLQILEQVLRSYDDLISERLSHHGGVFPPSKARKGLGRHIRKSDPDKRFCHGRRIRRRGYRNHPRTISTVFGKLKLPIRVAECCTCGARVNGRLKMGQFGSSEMGHINLPSECHSVPFLSTCLSSDNYFL